MGSLQELSERASDPNVFTRHRNAVFGRYLVNRYNRRYSSTGSTR